MNYSQPFLSGTLYHNIHFRVRPNVTDNASLLFLELAVISHLHSTCSKKVAIKHLQCKISINLLNTIY